MTCSVLVTGASKEIGRAIALRLAQDGFQIAVHFNRDREGAEQTLAQIQAAGGGARLLSFDVADRGTTRWKRICTPMAPITVSSATQVLRATPLSRR